MKLKDRLIRWATDYDVANAMDNMPKPISSLGYDPWGYNLETAKVGMSMVKGVYEKYFRVVTHGLENVPADGRVLIISNHSGVVPIDAGLLSYALATSEINPRATRAMMERFLPTVPFLGNILNEVGAVVGDPINCSKMLERDEAIMVFPEGVRGTGKTFKERYQLQRFGNGFMHLALDYHTPIIPVGITGCEEIMPSIGNIKWLANAMGLPYFPVALPIAIPSKVVINIGEPMIFHGQDESEEAVQAHVEEVKERIRSLIDLGLDEKNGAIL